MHSHTRFNRQIASVALSIALLLAAISNPAFSAVSPSVMESYNQACMASLADQTDEALNHFKKALSAGFDDFRYAMADSELTNLTNSKAFATLFTAHQSQQTLLSSERGFHLSSNIWSEWQNLPTNKRTNKNEASVRTQWQPLALALEIRLTGELAAAFAKPIQPPWNGGPGVILTLAVADDTSAFESSNTYQFGFGKNKSSGIGAIFLGEQLGWQPVGELTPEFSLLDKGQTAIIKATINWQSIRPYHPLVDSPLGMNVTIRGESNTDQLFTLFPDPNAFSPLAKIHRYVPIRFDAASESRESLAGRLSQSLLTDTPLTCDLKIISAQSGSGLLTVDFLDHQGNSVIPEGAAQSKFSCKTGVNSISRSADFRSLEMGPYLVKVELELPSGDSLNWSSQVLNMGPNWRGTLENQKAELATADQPTAQYYMDAIVQAVNNLPPRRHPGQVATTLKMLGSLLKTGAENGSILPESGLMQLIWQDHLGNNHLCSIYLPDGYRKAKTLEPVILLTDSYGLESRMAGRISRLYEHQDGPIETKDPNRDNFPIYLIPHWNPDNSQSLDEKFAELLDFNLWAESYFKFSGMALVGVDSAAGLALHFSNQPESDVSRLLIYAGARMNPWPQAQRQELVERFSGGTHAPVFTTWIDFPQETNAAGQSKLLLSILKDSKYNISVQEVRGGLSMTQVTDRLVLWVEKNP